MKRFLILVAVALIAFPLAASVASSRALDRLDSRGFDVSRLSLSRVVVDQLGETHTVFNQSVNGVPVYLSQVVTHERADGAFAGESVHLRLNDIHVDTTPRLSVSDAVRAARSAFGENAPAFATLYILPRSNGSAYQLAYRVEVNNTLEMEAFGFAPAETPRREMMLIDATNGRVIERLDYLQTVTTGNGYGFYAGQVSDLFISNLTSGYYYMNDTSSANGTATYNSRTTDMKNRQSGSGTIYSSTSTTFGDGTGSLSNRQSIGIDAHWFAQKTLDYYKVKHGRNGIDDQGNTTIGNGYMLSRTHYGRKYNNAFWNGSSMTYGDGDGTSYNPFDTVDVVGHEMTHGVTDRTSDLIYSKESGAANESYSDIFGAVVEFFVGDRTGYNGKVFSADWKIGEDLYISGSGMIRDVKNPPTKNDPDFYQEEGFWEFTSTDNYGVHTNSGVQNKVYYLLAVGGTNDHYDASGNFVTTHNPTVVVTGLGMDVASRIAFRALTVKLLGNSDATYAESKQAWIGAAQDLEASGLAPAGSATQAANAWTACGVN